MNTESVVIADQQVAVNTFSGLAHTARQANKVEGARYSVNGIKVNSAMGTKS